MIWLLLIWAVLEFELRWPEHRWHYRSEWVAWLGFEAMTVGRHIFAAGARGAIDPQMAFHERVHVDQWRRYTIPGFLVLHVYWALRWGYRANPLEVEARTLARAWTEKS